MKVSKKEKELTKEKILNAAVALMTDKGFKSTSMRDIAKEAGVSDPTVYNYFSTKEKIVYFYIENSHKKALDTLLNIKEFQTYSLREQLQTLFEVELDLYQHDRKFILEVFDMAFYSSTVKMQEIYNTKALFIEVATDIFDAAIEAGEIEEPPFKDILISLMWDYFIAIVAYWIKDDSEDFENTSAFIDHSISLLESILNSNILSKFADFGVFMFKTHILSNLTKFTKHKKKASILKRKLMDLEDE